MNNKEKQKFFNQLHFSLSQNNVIIDVGGRDSVEQRCALAVANVYAVPFCPSDVDLWTLEQVAELVEEPARLAKTFMPFAF